MANLKTKKTAAGAQQYSKPGASKALKTQLNKDLDRVHNKSMTRDDFKKKYGMSILKAQSMIYAADAADRSKKEENPRIKRSNDKYERDLVQERKQGEKDGYYSKGGMTKKMGYNKGGLSCGASNSAERPIKNGKS